MNNQNKHSQMHWKMIMLANDKMTNDFFYYQKKYGLFSTSYKLIKSKLAKDKFTFEDEDLLELNYFEEDQLEEDEQYIFDFGKTIYDGDESYYNFQKLIFDFISKTVEFITVQQIIPLLTHLNRALIYWGNALDLYDVKNAYITLCKMAHLEINKAFEIIDNLETNIQDINVIKKFRCQLLEVDSFIRQASYDILK